MNLIQLRVLRVLRGENNPRKPCDTSDITKHATHVHNLNKQKNK